MMKPQAFLTVLPTMVALRHLLQEMNLNKAVTASATQPEVSDLLSSIGQRGALHLKLRATLPLLDGHVFNATEALSMQKINASDAQPVCNHSYAEALW
eukprot:CAMPEP_0115095852 /NCGR_PEP_ID=MMETSP0227-20121206/29324_1 /TAXON_ID=89957 /ORGANISM="Polarella glacialis, Strain CCMP 1383" /LENGTH=97 /DNA_ID=CAMNT_0002489373 /DNA_START=89 /DNA_END=382 /DNA_ORIENTATION=+